MYGDHEIVFIDLERPSLRASAGELDGTQRVVSLMESKHKLLGGLLDQSVNYTART